MVTLALTLWTLAAAQQPGPEPPAAQDPGPDRVYATPALEALVERAAAANRRVPAGLTSYRARVETELSFVRLEADGRETVLQLEQVASDLSWRSDGGLFMQLEGYRAQMLGASFSALSFFDVPWTVPTLYGERLDLVRTGGPEYADDGTLLVRRSLHPFADGRDAVYRFSGGDTVLVLRAAGRSVPIVRIHVEPAHTPPRPTLLFHGDIDVDVTRMHVVAMQGRLLASGQGRSFLDAFAQGALFVRFESAEYDQAYWLPRTQRFEAQAISRLGEGRVVFRVISRFLNVDPNDPEAARLAVSPREHPLGLMGGAEELGRLARFADWRVPMGSLNERADAREFDSFGPPGLRPSGRPRLTLGARNFSSFLRHNQVEGLFTGGGLTFVFGDAAPGLRLRGHGGWAWREQTVRGGVELDQVQGDWSYAARAERTLAHTHDFLYAFQPEPDAPLLIGAEDMGYVDRRWAGLVARRAPRGGGIAWRLEASRVGDRVAGREPLPAGPLGPGDPEAAEPPPGAAPSPLHPVTPGDYWRTRVELRRNPSAGGMSMDPGLMLRLAYEGTLGGLEWQRFEAGAALRRMMGRWTLSLGGDAGIVFAPSPVPQALFELGAMAEVPGSGERVFAGDRAALGRATVMYTLPVLGAPLRMGAMWLPAPAPSPSVGLRLGWTDVSAQTRELMEALSWRTSDGARAAIDLRMRFFGGAISAGAARPLEAGGRWRFVWGLVGGF